MSHATARPRSRKGYDPAKWPVGRPEKPYPTFPLTPHVSGKWMKKILGEVHYFGSWATRQDGKLVRKPDDGWKDALDLYKAQADDLHAGRTPRPKGNELTIRELADRFLNAKKRRVEAGEIRLLTFNESYATCQFMADTLGKDRPVDDLRAEDFEELRSKMAERWGPVRLGNEIGRVKSLFKYGTDNGLLARPVPFGSEFRKPGKSVLRRLKAVTGGKMMEAHEVRKVVEAAPVQIKAMLLLMVNCGFGPTDCATLPLDAVDLKAGMIDFPRPKTGIARRCYLWKETVAALKAAIAERPEPRRDEAERLVFLTGWGRPWITADAPSALTKAVIAVMKEVGVHRKGRGPYTLRHVFRTAADACLDRVAIDLAMGHGDSSMAGHYRERIDDSRLKAVSECVHRWLFPPKKKRAKKS